MVRGLYTAAAGALVAQAQADTIANNLANVNTSGFKRTLLQVSSGTELNVFALQNRPDGTAAGAPSSDYIGSLGLGSQVYDTPAVFEQGGLQNTGNALDTAIQGNGFFAVNTPAGVRYTRDGQFARDNNGVLVTLDGNPVLGRNGAITLNANGPVQIRENGDVVQNGNVIDTLQITQFANPVAVRPEGDNLFSAGPAAQPQPDTASTVHQGYLERSNANVVRSMVDLIAAQRWYEANSKMIQTQDTTNGYAIANVGRTNAQ